MSVISLSTTWSDGQVLTASALNGNFSTIVNDYNGGITNANISSSAAVTESKITFSGSGHGHTGGSDGKVVTVRRGYGFYISGSASVANNLSWNPTAPAAETATGLYLYAQTAPSGSSLTVQVYNVTQSHVVASTSISSGSSTGSTTSMTNAAISANDVLRVDVTAIGSTTAGANISVVLDVTQP